MNQEIESLREFIFHELNKKIVLGNFDAGEGNKLISFSVAKDCGLKIPETFIGTQLTSLKKHAGRYQTIPKAVPITPTIKHH